MNIVIVTAPVMHTRSEEAFTHAYIHGEKLHSPSPWQVQGGEELVLEQRLGSGQGQKLH